MDGLELLDWVRSTVIFRNIPFILLTASKDNIDLSKAYELGVKSFLDKPVRFADVAEGSAAIESYWLKFNLV